MQKEYHFIVTVIPTSDVTEKDALAEITRLLSESVMFKGGEAQAADKFAKN